MSKKTLQTCVSVVALEDLLRHDAASPVAEVYLDLKATLVASRVSEATLASGVGCD